MPEVTIAQGLAYSVDVVDPGNDTEYFARCWPTMARDPDYIVVCKLPEHISLYHLSDKTIQDIVQTKEHNPR